MKKNKSGIFKRSFARLALLMMVLMLCMPILAFAAAPSAPPTNVHASNITGTGATLGWTASVDATTTGYEVYKAGVLYKTVGNVTSTVISGLTKETTYAITVKAKNADGTSAASDAYSLVTTASAFSINFDMSQMFSYAQMIIDVLMPVLYITLGIALGFIVIRALKSAFN